MAYLCLSLLIYLFGCANANIDAAVTESSSTPGANLSWPDMDPDVSDLEYQGSEAGTSPLEDDSDLEFDSDSSDELDASPLHPCLELSSKEGPDNYDHGSLCTQAAHNVDAANAAALPEGANKFDAAGVAPVPVVVQRLQKQLLAGYTLPPYPPIKNPCAYALTESDELSLKHYITWVDSRGTVKAYGLHAQVLQEATNIEILSLYRVRKLAMEVLGLTSQLVDMCPKSCTAFTGEFKDLQLCTHVREKCGQACGQPRFDNKGLPRAQMAYTPIGPVIQSFYGNREMAVAMRYRHENLQKALKKLSPHSSPTEYSDFSDSISHINHANHLSLFQNDTDTAITISGDGAQLTMKKQSDVWVLIVTILNLPPNMRSKATNVIIPLVIPGPHSPGNVESFVYVLYEELAKLSVGLWTWDALLERYFVLKVYLCGVLGDMLGSAKLSKMAGHMALHGCRFSTVQGARSSANKGVI